MVEQAKSGHPGGAMGASDFIHILFSEYLKFSPDHPEWIARDRFFLDPGHMSTMLYAVQAMFGKYTLEDLKSFRQWKSVTPGHPELDIMRGIENGSGPLGLGHTLGVGAAIAAKKMKSHFGELMQQRIFAFISDGGIQEEISQGAGRIAGHLGLNNLIMFYDANDVQLSTRVHEVTSENVALKYQAWNWHVIEIDGNDHDQIRKALDEAIAVEGKPTLIIGNTRMGKGALGEAGKSYEDRVDTHGQPLSAAGADIKATIEALDGNPEDPFTIHPEVQKIYDDRQEQLRREYAAWEEKFKKWQEEQPELAKELDKWLSLDTSDLKWEEIEQKPNGPTRAASSTVLGYLAERVPNMIVSSADLSNSDKTDGFLKKTHAITKDDFSGGFLQAGVSELTMATLCTGITLHGGFFATCGTFFVFSDYMKPVIRLAALMEVPVKFVWSHDAFRVGEDGPTHQPVEHEAQIRLMEHLHNHSGKPSMLVLRPADVHEATHAWRLAMENDKTPTGLIFSRQNINDLPENDYAKSERVAQGAYIVRKVDRPQAVLLASGSEVSTLVAGAELLQQQGIEVNVVSVPSEGLFRQQSEAYQEEVLPSDVKRFGLTAGLSITLQGLVPPTQGAVWGLQSFGFSAPYKVLDEKLGFTAENVVKQVTKLLK